MELKHPYLKCIKHGDIWSVENCGNTNIFQVLKVKQWLWINAGIILFMFRVSSCCFFNWWWTNYYECVMHIEKVQNNLRLFLLPKQRGEGVNAWWCPVDCKFAFIIHWERINNVWAEERVFISTYHHKFPHVNLSCSGEIRQWRHSQESCWEWKTAQLKSGCVVVNYTSIS